jgi:hypothetical protein
VEVWRDRIYELQLITADGRALMLTRRRFADETIPSQQVYRVAPRGRWLAVGMREGLVLLDRAARPWPIAPDVADFRFSPDGSWLAVATRTPGELRLIDIRGDAPVTRRRVGLSNTMQLEWSAAGVVIARTAAPGEDELVLLPLDGEPRPFYRGQLSRIAAAARGWRVAAFSPQALLDFDLQNPAPPRRWLGRYVVDNAEMAADGSALLFVTSQVDASRYEGAFRVDDNGIYPLYYGAVPSLWAADEAARFVWLGDDGQMRVGDARYPTGLAGKVYGSARFRRDGPGIIGTTGDRVLAWDADGGHEQLLWRSASEKVRLIGADRYAGGLVVWQESPAPDCRDDFWRCNLLRGESGKGCATRYGECEASSRER